MNSLLPNRKLGLFQHFIEHSTGNVLLIDADGIIIYASHQAKAIFGETSGKQLEALFSGLNYRNASEKLVVFKNRRYQFNIMPDPEKDFTLIEVLAASFSEQAIAISPVSRAPYLYDFKLLQSLISGLPGVIYRYRYMPRGAYDFLSDQIENLTNYPRKEFVPFGKKRIHDLILNTDRPHVELIIQNAQKNFKPYYVHYRIETKDHSIKWLYEKSHFIHEGDEVYCEGIILDVTDEQRQDTNNLRSALELDDLISRQVAETMQNEVQQKLTAALYAFESLEQKLPQGHNSRLTYQRGIEVLRDSIDQARAASTMLSPKTLLDFGLVDSLMDLTESMDGNYEAKVLFHSNEKEVNLSFFQANSIFRIAQEALTNSLKHGMAQNVTVQLRVQPNMLSLSIEDDGKGFDTTSGTKGLGLRMIHARAKAIGAVLYLESKLQKGTILNLEMPF